MGNWKSARVITLLVILSGTVFLISGCQKSNYEYCTPNVKPDQFWAKYNLPKVEGAILCSDYMSAKNHVISFIHYHEGEKKLTDFSDSYEDEFKKNGWKIEDYKSMKYSLGTYVSKEGEKFFVEFSDCYAGRENYVHRPCVSVDIMQADDITKSKSLILKETSEKSAPTPRTAPARPPTTEDVLETTDKNALATPTRLPTPKMLSKPK
jgi:hypothetical protein